MNSLPFGQLKSFLKILIGVQYQTEKGVFRVPARKELHMGRNNSMQKPSIVTRLKSDQAVAVASVAADGLWLARWGLGAAIGLWELLRIRKRKVLI